LSKCFRAMHAKRSKQEWQRVLSISQLEVVVSTRLMPVNAADRTST
jgi:hypothetical protein